MRKSVIDALNEVAARGWKVQRSAAPSKLPTAITSRYPWLPPSLITVLGEFTLVVSPTDTSWWNTVPELRGESDSAFAWNERELESLAAAKDDVRWQQVIRDFWDLHFPFVLSVKPNYWYLAVRKDQKIVRGEEPEFEATTVLAEDFDSFLQRLAEGDEHLTNLF